MRRRTLLLGPFLGTLFGLTLVVLPVVRAPSTTPPPVHMSSQVLTAADRTVGAGWSKVIDGTTDMVGVRWQGDRSATFTVETRDRHGHWSRADAVGVPDGGPDVGSAEARRAERAGNVSEPVWVGHATAVRIRVAHGSARAIDVQKVHVPRATASGNVASAAAPNPGIISRAQWGADERLRLANCPEGPSYDANVDLAIVHHTDGSNNYGPADSPAIMRGLYAYATQTLQYCDMHYNFLVDRFGQIFEGRYGGVTAPVHGAHSVGWNTSTTGIATMGDFQTAPPPTAMVASLERLIAWKFDVHGVNPTTPFTYVTAGNDKFAPGTPVTVPTCHRPPGHVVHRLPGRVPRTPAPPDPGDSHRDDGEQPRMDAVGVARRLAGVGGDLVVVGHQPSRRLRHRHHRRLGAQVVERPVLVHALGEPLQSDRGRHRRPGGDLVGREPHRRLRHGTRRGAAPHVVGRHAVEPVGGPRRPAGVGTDGGVVGAEPPRRVRPGDQRHPRAQDVDRRMVGVGVTRRWGGGCAGRGGVGARSDRRVRPRDRQRALPPILRRRPLGHVGAARRHAERGTDGRRRGSRTASTCSCAAPIAGSTTGGGTAGSGSGSSRSVAH